MSDDTQAKLQCVNLVLKNLEKAILKNDNELDTKMEMANESGETKISTNRTLSVRASTQTLNDEIVMESTENTVTAPKKLYKFLAACSTVKSVNSIAEEHNDLEEVTTDLGKQLTNETDLNSKFTEKRKIVEEETAVPLKQYKYTEENPEEASNKTLQDKDYKITFDNDKSYEEFIDLTTTLHSKFVVKADGVEQHIETELHQVGTKDHALITEKQDNTLSKDLVLKSSKKPEISKKSIILARNQSKNSEDIIIKTPERKSIIEIRISNEVNTLLDIPCEQLMTSPKPDHQIIDLEKRQGNEDIQKSEEQALQTTETNLNEFVKLEEEQMVHNNETTNNIQKTLDDQNPVGHLLKEEKVLSLTELNDIEQSNDQQYRATCLPFLQHVPCFKLKTSINASYDDEMVPRCRECRRKDIFSTGPTTTNEIEVLNAGNDVYCRFYEFRRLQYTTEGDLFVAGFPNPYEDPQEDDINIWQPDKHTEPTAGYMDVQVCRYILLHVGDQFCYLWQQEVEALKMHENKDKEIAWKKLVRDIREICDVCDTTLFNYHWTCNKCGFGVCIDCFKDRKEKHVRQKFSSKSRRGRDEFYWFLCTNSQKHQLAELMLTQIITGDSLKVLGKLLHEVRIIWKIPQKCDCLLSRRQILPEGKTKQKIDEIVNDMINESRLNQQTASSSLATKETLRHQRRMEKVHKNKLDFARSLGIDYVPGRMITKETLDKDPITTAFDSYEHINFLRKGMAGFRRFLPPKVMTMCSSTLLAPNVRHEWLCDGKLLRLTDPMHPDNRILFQEVWKCGQPVMISEVARSLNLNLWRPEAFCLDFGDKPNDLINCLNGNLVPNQPMRHFWEGFQCIKKRLLDASGNPMLLKLKDWPPGDDFAEILPTRYADLMTGLPLPEYTLRTGNLNIASCLPKTFVPPDLGPKMYNAYGSALHPDKGTTNLHLDISDAVNVMVYVGIPQDAESKSQLDAAQHAIAMGGCDFLTRLRCQSSKVMPGALWHIFAARDADKIRDLLNRVTLEKGFRLEPDHDPIHDQNWYLDDELRARLFREYRVKGYPIVQCLGDAVFIPAGAPHQVQNLHNCIKVAEDFVSPENITHCYHLTHEFRQLSNSHTNHEDKLQIKNIIFHAVKDCCTILMRALDKRYEVELAEWKRKRKLRKEQAKNMDYSTG